MGAKKVAVLLSGCGVYDGSEIHESVLTLLSLANAGLDYECFAPDKDQHHVINHRTGEPMEETRNVLTESARIARGEIKPLNELSVEAFDALVIPGGFGTAKNHTKWAFEGPAGAIDTEVRDAIRSFHAAGKVITAFCMAPTTVAKAFEGTEVHAQLSVGTTEESSPYEIEAITDGMKSIGSIPNMVSKADYSYDEENRIFCSPCYMMDMGIAELAASIDRTIQVMAKKL